MSPEEDISKLHFFVWLCVKSLMALDFWNTTIQKKCSFVKG